VRARPDLASLVAGLAVIALGVLLLLDAEDSIHMDFALFAPVACAATGAILVATGMSRDR
jgi:hypothetical protein